MRMTDHFEREGITYEMCVEIVQEPWHSEESGDERIFWGYAPQLPGETRWLKVVTDSDARTLISAYKDRRFARRVERGEI